MLPCLFCLVSGFDEPPEQVPELDLSKARFFASPVIDFFCEQVGEVWVIELSEGRVTVALPVFPHMAVRLKDESRGRSRFEGGDTYLLLDSFHLSYSFSSMAMLVRRRLY